MGNNLLAENPFAVLTFIVAPAILTNATSVLAMSTINRMLRTRERMRELFVESENAREFRGKEFVEQVNRVEQQAALLLRALRWIYISLGSFAAASLVTLLGAVSGHLSQETLMRVVVNGGLLLGIIGVTGLVCGSVNLLRATQLSLMNINEEAALIRARQKQYENSPDQPGAK